MRSTIVLCIIIIIIATLLSSINIETFINFSQTTVANDIPADPNDFSCYNYIKKQKGWALDVYDQGRKRMVNVMRTGFADRKSDLYSNNPYNATCIVPAEHSQLFGFSADCKLKDHALIKTDAGCVLDFHDSYKDEETYKNLLTEMEISFNKKYLDAIAILNAEIVDIEEQINIKRAAESILDGNIIAAEKLLKDNCDAPLINEFIGSKKDLNQYAKTHLSNLQCSSQNAYTDNNDNVARINTFVNEKIEWNIYYPPMTQALNLEIKKIIDEQSEIIL